jgi:hypothetical protein
MTEEQECIEFSGERNGDDLPSFAAPQDFRGRRRARPLVRYVDPPGFPMLNPIVPSTRKGLIRLRRSLRERRSADGAMLDLSPHFLNECRLHVNLCSALRASRSSERPVVLIDHLRSAYVFPSESTKEIYERLASYVVAAWELFAEFVEEFVHDSLRAPLTSDGVADSVSDPVELLVTCSSLRVVEGSRISRLRAFEMRRALVLAEELMALDLGAASLSRVNAVEAALSARLEERFFEKNLDRQVVVRAAIEKESGACLAILAEREEPPPGSQAQSFPFVIRYFRFGGRIVPVYFRPDKKRLTRLLLKMLAKTEKEPFAIPDINRFVMVLRNGADLGACLTRIEESVFPVGGTSHAFESNIRALRTAVLSNSASSSDYRVVKVDHVFRGNKVEGQYQTLRDYIESITSKSGGNHRAYKGRQVQPVRQILIPTELYQIDWNQPEIRELHGLS